MTGPAVSASNNPQAQHYDRILDDYDRHYYDPYSLQYRERFILNPLLHNLHLHGKRVADLASGSGETSLYLAQRFRGIELHGFDVSPQACRRYEARVGAPSRQLDLTLGHYDGPLFDAAVIMGGLHHCAKHLPATLQTIRKMLAPGGALLMFEPNRDYMLEPVRQFWYGRDHYFDEDAEAALSHDELLAAADGAFTCERVQYFGGPAFFLIYNSLVLRVPHGLKARISPALMKAESLYERLPGRWAFASFLARWTRR